MSSGGSPQPEDRKAPSRIARRGFLLGGVGLAALAGGAAFRWFNVTADVGESDLTAPQAHEAATTGKLVLVDIRRPDEWTRTGVGAGATPIDMRSDDFIQSLLMHTEGRRNVPVALICARGVRSARLSAQLADAGFTQIIDVPEGMLGSGAGPGWLARGLPVVSPDDSPNL
ncbi:MAG: rhodanese-like domain-containing protein [Sulfitobacter sp.]